MKRLIILVLFVFTTLAFDKQEVMSTKEFDTTVYVCGKSTIYHKPLSHSALGRCKSGITKMSESTAINKGKRECRCRN